MKRWVAPVGVALAASLLVVPGVSAQEPDTAPLEVVSRSFTDADGVHKSLFGLGELIHATLGLRATGEQAVTGITGTLSFPRGTVVNATSTWPDAEPGAPVENSPPFTFSWGEPTEPDDADCFIILDGIQVDPDEVVDDVDADLVVASDPADDPSDPFEPIPPGEIAFSIVSDQGTLEEALPFQAICSIAAHGDGIPERAPRVLDVSRLAATGADVPMVALLGAGFLALGLVARRASAQSR